MAKKIQIIDESTPSDAANVAAVPAPAPAPFTPTPAPVAAQEAPKPAVTAEGLKQAVALVGKAQPGMRKASSVLSAVPITDVTVIIGMINREGHREEIIHDINTEERKRIVLCNHNIEEKMQKAKDDEGAFIGYEPTGEYTLTLKVKYITE